MIRLDYLLLGYRAYTVENEDVFRVADIFLKKGISVRFYENRFYARGKKSEEIERALSSDVKYSRSEILGFYGFLYKNRKRYGVMFALVCTLILLFLSSDRVWDVRIEGCEEDKKEMIENELSDCGFYVGSRWSKTDLGRIEVDVLSKSDSISWLNINRRGTVAYVKVVEKEVHVDPPKKEGYSNVVATCDAVIEEITVMRGIPMVKAGDSVKKGDLLISGVIPGELGGGYCYAEGIVIGRVSDSVKVSVSNVREVKKEEKRKLSTLSVKIFGFSINIFKSYRNLDCECDTINNKSKLRFFGTELPITVQRKYYAPYKICGQKLSYDEMTAVASEKMYNQLNERLSDATLIRIGTEGEFLDSDYVMISDFVCLEKIGADLPFEVKGP